MGTLTVWKFDSADGADELEAALREGFRRSGLIGASS
jgi:hypothetical protein